VGDEREIRRSQPTVVTHPRFAVATTEVVTMEDGPMEVLRRKKDSSMARAIEEVAADRADAVLSCGNTDACWRRRRSSFDVCGIDRPGIATVIPTPRTSST
jgi:glycerol-3-phosphate acyltransferase PlsX